MGSYLRKSRMSKLLLTFTLATLSVFLINKAQAKDEASRLKKSDSAVYYDEKTGLEWLAGPDKPTSWFAAKRWVKSLASVAGGGWRMPTIKELKTLYQKVGKCNIKPVLKTTGCWIWSGETKGPSLAWGYDYTYEPGGSILSGGSTTGSGPALLKRDDSNDSTRGFAVRSRR